MGRAVRRRLKPRLASYGRARLPGGVGSRETTEQHERREVTVISVTPRLLGPPLAGKTASTEEHRGAQALD